MLSQMTWKLSPFDRIFRFRYFVEILWVISGRLSVWYKADLETKENILYQKPLKRFSVLVSPRNTSTYDSKSPLEMLRACCSVPGLTQ